MKTIKKSLILGILTFSLLTAFNLTSVENNPPGNTQLSALENNPPGNSPSLIVAFAKPAYSLLSLENNPPGN